MPVHERPHSRYRLAWGGRPRTMFSISHGVAFVQGVELSVCQPRRMSQPPIDPTQPPSAPHARSAITRSAPSGSNSAGRVSASQAEPDTRRLLLTTPSRFHKFHAPTRARPAWIGRPAPARNVGSHLARPYPEGPCVISGRGFRGSPRAPSNGGIFYTFYTHRGGPEIGVFEVAE